jgi:aerobic-type carbon monoxide dehydrogenase small subunit (CoxS/CutS family)
VDVILTFTVNGSERKIAIDPERPLLDALREDLRLAGVQHRCGEGRCGGCVVLLDGKRVLSCQTPLAQADKRAITIIE